MVLTDWRYLEYTSLHFRQFGSPASMHASIHFRIRIVPTQIGIVRFHIALVSHIAFPDTRFYLHLSK